MRTCFTYGATWTPGFHIGAARVSILNMILAKKSNSNFVIFCDDSDRRTETQCSVILQMLSWLGIHHQEGVYHTSTLLWQYEKTLQNMLRNGWAYVDYAFPEEVEVERREALNCGKPFLYSRKFMAVSDSDHQRFEREGRQPVVRLKMPRSSDESGLYKLDERVVKDAVTGKLRKYNLAEEHDFIVKRADGSFTPYLLTACNYNELAIDFAFVDSTYLRGLPAQIFIASRSNFKLPQISYVPFLLGSKNGLKFNSKKLDIQLGDRSFKELYNRVVAVKENVGTVVDYGPYHPCYIEFYRRVGFLPEAIFHYLLTTTLKSDSSLYNASPVTFDVILDKFSLDDISAEPSVFDAGKVLSMQKKYMDFCDRNRKGWLINSFLNRSGVSRHSNFGIDSMPLPDDLCSFLDTYGESLLVGGDILEKSQSKIVV